MRLSFKVKTGLGFEQGSIPVGCIRPAWLPTVCATVATRCQYWWGEFSSETVLTDLQSWPPDVSGR